LHVHFEHLEYIDHACLDLLMNWEKQHESTGGSLVIDWDSLTARFRSFRSPGNGNGNGNGNGHSNGNGKIQAPAVNGHSERELASSRAS
jgi:hypothetical protein